MLGECLGECFGGDWGDLGRLVLSMLGLSGEAWEASNCLQTFSMRERKQPAGSRVLSTYAVHTLAQDRVRNHAEAFVHTQSRSSSVSALPSTSSMYSTRTHNGDGPDLEAAKKATLCFDCGQAGHWAGDDEFTSPKKGSRRRREQGGKGLGKRKGTFRGKKKTNKKKQKTRRVRRQAMAGASRRLRRQNQNTVITEDLEQTASGGVSSSCQGGEPQNRTPIAETGEAAEVAQVQANSPCSRIPQAMDARR